MSAEFFAKIVLLGDGAVGKTSIRRRFMGKGFISQHLMTIGADFSEKKGRFETNATSVNYILQIWDIAGQKDFKLIRQRFLRNALGMIVVFDLTDKRSFQNLSQWILEAWQANNDMTLPILVVGNKIDLEDQRQIKKSLIGQFCDKLQTKYPKIHSIELIETSALTGENVTEGFEMMIRAIYQKRQLLNE